MAEVFAGMRHSARSNNLRLSEVAQAAIAGTLDPQAIATLTVENSPLTGDSAPRERRFSTGRESMLTRARAQHQEASQNTQPDQTTGVSSIAG
jgi:hypothetical protein